jgi:hypothetical protein
MRQMSYIVDNRINAGGAEKRGSGDSMYYDDL